MHLIMKISFIIRLQFFRLIKTVNYFHSITSAATPACHIICSITHSITSAVSAPVIHTAASVASGASDSVVRQWKFNIKILSKMARRPAEEEEKKENNEDDEDEEEEEEEKKEDVMKMKNINLSN
ncbi:predicted protein [Uncinocarpus reesii 1704]|uniref:Uncharacterized protein n=1 Tax=Uncinocarpus reesii (strain UAMH 1704) TaxID=336963 RepID=C4JXW3_UNCRE|nr:uncharacterized protein UREG_07901 [Uncinocarpus reesii 1704]EEP83036.1 predicted protein [Uncinocarpus reesii 1704]